MCVLFIVDSVYILTYGSVFHIYQPCEAYVVGMWKGAQRTGTNKWEMMVLNVKWSNFYIDFTFELE